MTRIAFAFLFALSGCVAAGGTGTITGSPAGDTLSDVERGAVMPAGQVGRTCGAGRRPPGTVVERFPAEGRSRWQIHDTAPGTTAPRTHYITGFSDGCARQVTGALVVFGGPAVYEAMRLSGANRPAAAATDELYDRIRARICGVNGATRCPSSRLGRLEERMTFVSVYSRLGASGDRLDLLLDDGDLVAQAALR